jgi:hypothetical protein
VTEWVNCPRVLVTERDSAGVTAHDVRSGWSRNPMLRIVVGGMRLAYRLSSVPVTRAPTHDLPVATLVLSPVAGDAGPANELRLHGYPAWVAANEDDLTWLLEQARVRPEYSLVDLSSSVADRPLRVLVMLAALARRACLPVVLVGAEEHEVPVFHGVVASLPRGSGVGEIVGAMRKAVA